MRPVGSALLVLSATTAALATVAGTLTLGTSSDTVRAPVVEMARLPAETRDAAQLDCQGDDVGEDDLATILVRLLRLDLSHLFGSAGCGDDGGRP